jgi:hypothetical protein
LAGPVCERERVRATPASGIFLLVGRTRAKEKAAYYQDSHTQQKYPPFDCACQRKENDISQPSKKTQPQLSFLCFVFSVVFLTPTCRLLDLFACNMQTYVDLYVCLDHQCVCSISPLTTPAIFLVGYGIVTSSIRTRLSSLHKSHYILLSSAVHLFLFSYITLSPAT